MKKTTARTLVTYACNRACEGCCNNQISNLPIKSLKELCSYQEIIITGGEPMLFSEEIMSMIKELRNIGYHGKLYLQTAYHDINKRISDRNVFSTVDGISYTIHKDLKEKDILRVKELLSFFEQLKDTNRSDRIFIEEDIFETILKEIPEITNESYYSLIVFPWKEYCPIPKHEELVYFNLF